MLSKDFGPCEICGVEDWELAYCGPVRDGRFGNHLDSATVATCGGCGVGRLAERCCPSKAIYETPAYRAKLGQGLSSGEHFATADDLQKYAFDVFSTNRLRGKVVADVGCAGGSFLDHVSGLAGQCIAIEPNEVYRQSLADRDYRVFPYVADALDAVGRRVDIATSFLVIEHVQKPREFLQEIRSLLAPDGSLLISTPNRRDILMDLIPDDFPAFFHRVVHRWYFDADSLAACARLAGFEVEETRHIHRYGLSNALLWLRDRRPGGHARLDVITHDMDRWWQGQLEAQGRSDTLFMLLKAT